MVTARAATITKASAPLAGAVLLAWVFVSLAGNAAQREQFLLPALAAGAAAAWLLATRAPLSWILHVFIFLVVFAAYVPLALSIGGLNLRVSQAFLPLVWVRLLGSGAVSRLPRRIPQLCVAGGLFWSAALFWTLLHLDTYPSPVLPLGRVALLGINLLHMATIYILVIYTRRLRQAVLSLLLAMTVFNLLLLAAGTGATGGLVSFERFLVPEAAPVLVGGQVLGADVPRFVVGVVTGNLSAAALVLLAAVSLQRTKAAGAAWRWAATAFAVTGIVLGFSRQAVVGLVAGLAAVGLDLLRCGRLKRLGLFLLSLPLVGALFWLTAQLPPTQSFFQALAGRAWLLADEGSYRTGTAGEKLRMWAAILEDVARNPLLGAGQDSYMVYYPSTTGGGSHNFPIEILHATGLSGFLPYAYLHAALLWTAWGALGRAHRRDEDRWLLLGLAGAFVVVVLSSLTNLIFWTQAYWLIAGLLAAGSRLTSRTPPQLYAHRIRHANREPA